MASHHPVPPPHRPRDRSVREAVVALCVMLAGLTYTMTYIILFGHVPANGQVEYAWGLPSWVSFGVILPWLVCVLVSWWYAYFFMADETWEDEPSSDRSIPHNINERAYHDAQGSQHHA